MKKHKRTYRLSLHCHLLNSHANPGEKMGHACTAALSCRVTERVVQTGSTEGSTSPDVDNSGQTGKTS